MRGKAGFLRPSSFLTGITPAYAGKSQTEFCGTTSKRDHPRVCGEKFAHVSVPNRVVGSPPRMRGKVLFVLEKAVIIGITPAYAGKRDNERLLGADGMDHPRVCGEKWPRYRHHPRAVGSPPRMRGKVNHIRQRQTYPGITPAYAGKRNWQSSTMKTEKDHPRVCGEKFGFDSAVRIACGSPPRMRGKVYGSPDKNRRNGITPAYAGKSFADCKPFPTREDHPRVCGEKR